MINDLLAVATAESVAHVYIYRDRGGCIIIIFQSSLCIYIIKYIKQSVFFIVVCIKFHARVVTIQSQNANACFD